MRRFVVLCWRRGSCVVLSFVVHRCGSSSVVLSFVMLWWRSSMVLSFVVLRCSLVVCSAVLGFVRKDGRVVVPEVHTRIVEMSHRGVVHGVDGEWLVVDRGLMVVGRGVVDRGLVVVRDGVVGCTAWDGDVVRWGVVRVVVAWWRVVVRVLGGVVHVGWGGVRRAWFVGLDVVLDVVDGALGGFVYGVANGILDDVHDVHTLVELVAKIGVDGVRGFVETKRSTFESSRSSSANTRNKANDMGRNRRDGARNLETKLGDFGTSILDPPPSSLETLLHLPSRRLEAFFDLGTRCLETLFDLPARCLEPFFDLGGGGFDAVSDFLGDVFDAFADFLEAFFDFLTCGFEGFAYFVEGVAEPAAQVETTFEGDVVGGGFVPGGFWIDGIIVFGLETNQACGEIHRCRVGRRWGCVECELAMVGSHAQEIDIGVLG